MPLSMVVVTNISYGTSMSPFTFIPSLALICYSIINSTLVPVDKTTHTGKHTYTHKHKCKNTHNKRTPAPAQLLAHHRASINPTSTSIYVIVIRDLEKIEQKVD